jgi:hypothetical protein
MTMPVGRSRLRPRSASAPTGSARRSPGGSPPQRRRSAPHEAASLAAYESTCDRLSTELFSAADAIASYDWDTTEVNRLLRRLTLSMAAEVEALLALERPVRALAS